MGRIGNAFFLSGLALVMLVGSDPWIWILFTVVAFVVGYQFPIIGNHRGKKPE